MNRKQIIIVVSLSVIVLALLFGSFFIKNRSKSNIDSGFQNVEAECQKDAETYTGLTESTAIGQANNDGHEARVVERNGEGLAMTMDLRVDRVNFIIVNDKVSEAFCG